MSRKKKVVIASSIVLVMLLVVAIPAMASILWGPFGSPYVRVENPNGQLLTRGQDVYPNWSVQGTPSVDTICTGSTMYACRCWLVPVTNTTSTRIKCFLAMMTPTPAPTMAP